MIMLQMPCSGNRVVEIAEKTYLSRPAVSHHLQILKNAGIVKSRKKGKNVYYYLASGCSELDDLMGLLQQVKEIMQYAPVGNGDE